MTHRFILALVLTTSFAGGAFAQGLSGDDERLLQRLVLAEALGEGQLGMALVARSVLNRTALVQSRALPTGTYLARGRNLRGVVYGRMQYEPISSGTINRRRTPRQLQSAQRAIDLARNTPALRAALRAQRLSDTQIRNLLRATGFRARTAYHDPSQSFDRVRVGNHIFNTDRYSRRKDTIGLFERYFATGVRARETSARPTERAAPAAPAGRGSPAPEPARAVAERSRPAPTPARSTSATREHAADARVAASRPAEATNTPPRPAPVTLKLGAMGDDVKRLQRQLETLPSGFFGLATQNALKIWQRDRGLRPTGEVDGPTREALASAGAPSGEVRIADLSRLP